MLSVLRETFNREPSSCTSQAKSCEEEQNVLVPSRAVEVPQSSQSHQDASFEAPRTALARENFSRREAEHAEGFR